MRTSKPLNFATAAVGLCLAAPSIAQQAYFHPPGLPLSLESSIVTGGAEVGGFAAKAKIVRLFKTPGGVHDGRLVVVYGDAASTEIVWDPKSGEHLVNDLFVRYSDDDGTTWSNPVNVSNTAGLWSARTDWNGDGVTEPYWGDSAKPTIFNSGDLLVVSWVDKYVPESAWTFGTSAESAVQGTVSYPDIEVYPNQREVPYAGVYLAISYDGGTTWAFGDLAFAPPLQLTFGRRDAIQDLHRGSGNRWVVTWQEDPAGLQPGEADGPGSGASGAKVSKGTDVWYTFTPDIVASPLALRENRVPLTNHSMYDIGGTNGFPMVGTAGSVENHGASRANLLLMKDGTLFRTLVAYEETKGIPEIVEGKTVHLHSFPFDTPSVNVEATHASGDAGVVLTDLLQNSRRVRFVGQSPNGIDPALVIFWRQGVDTEGGPADILCKVCPTLDALDVLAAPTLNLSSNTPTASAENLLDPPTLNVLEDARAHRALLRGSFVAIGFTYTPNGPLARFTNLANYNFWLRRSLDGGQTWLDPQNLSNIVDTTINVKEPRLVGPAKTGTEDDSTFLVAWGTETNVYEGLEEIVPLDIEITATADYGATYRPVAKVAGTLGEEFESQLRPNDDCSLVYSVWMDTERSGSTEAKFAVGGPLPPLYVEVDGSPAYPGDLVGLELHAPGYEAAYYVGAAAYGFWPGFDTLQGHVPLNRDTLFRASFYAPAFINLRGFVPATGVVPAAVWVPAEAVLSGLDFYVAFAAYDETRPWRVSPPAMIEIR